MANFSKEITLERFQKAASLDIYKEEQRFLDSGLTGLSIWGYIQARATKEFAADLVEAYTQYMNGAIADHDGFNDFKTYARAYCKSFLIPISPFSRSTSQFSNMVEDNKQSMYLEVFMKCEGDN